MRRAQPWLGTLVHIECDSDDDSLALNATRAAFDQITLVHRLMSFQEPSSELGQFNQLTVNTWMTISAPTAAVLRFALDLHQRCDGLFDVCSAGFHLAGYGTSNQLELDDANNRIKKHGPVQVNLSGIAKGYAVDLATSTLIANGIDSGIVNAGGDLRIFGPRKRPISVRHPVMLDQEVSIGAFHNQAIATSASYFESGSNILSRAVQNGAEAIQKNHSWTVAAPNCMTADSLTKVLALTVQPKHPIFATYNATAWIIA
jgi:FAD:protein FMN transferase